MINEIEASTKTLDSSSDTIDLGLRQETEKDPQKNEIWTSEITLRSVDERIKQAIDPVLRRVGELCVLLASRIVLESTGNSAATG